MPSSRDISKRTYPDWVRRSVAQGFRSLLALSLPGTPARDVVNTTLDVWCRALTRRHQWEEDLDAPRFEAAFDALIENVTRWPAPADFMGALPSRPSTLIQRSERQPPDPAAHARTMQMLKDLTAKLEISNAGNAATSEGGTPEPGEAGDGHGT